MNDRVLSRWALLPHWCQRPDEIFRTIDGDTASAVAASEVATLAHEVGAVVGNMKAEEVKGEWCCCSILVQLDSQLEFQLT